MFKIRHYGNNFDMSKFKFINIVDTIFLSVATFLIIFAWVQFFIKNILLSLFCSAIIATAVIVGIKWFKSKKYNASMSRAKRNSSLALFKLAIQTMPSTKLNNMIKKLIPSHYLPKSNKGDINFVKDNKVHTFTFYYENILTCEKMLELIKTKSANHLTLTKM